MMRFCHSDLQRLQHAAEKAVERSKFNHDLKLANVSYVNVNDLDGNDTDVSLEHDAHFGQEVDLEQSGVHIPIEIYEGCEFNYIQSLQCIPTLFSIEISLSSILLY